ncbi:MAG TPA: MerR family transcriptional regulator [Xanthomonadales bacterium]|nr:MerR family transcriptional regulator [Xanthomonadales bacterium]
MSDPKEKNKEHFYGIGTVARLTGLTDHTIRAWERRHGAVVARRADNGRREYSTADLDKLSLLKMLIDQGVAISVIANDSIEELRERAQELGDTPTLSTPSEIRVAILGDLLPGMLSKPELAPSPVTVVIADINRARFEADLNRLSSDVIVLESAVLNNDTIAQMNDYLETAGITRGVMVYTFARKRDIDAARRARLEVLRAPVSTEELAAGVIRTYAAHPKQRQKPSAEAPPSRDWESEGAIAPRRFNRQQLANLAGITSDVDCECPRHLAQLVSDLSAFEIYSSQCASRNDDDAALHRYLHRTTAEARALVEGALEEVAVAEELKY